MKSQTEGKKEIIKFKKQSGTTSCNKFCGYFSGSPSKHTCGKPIYKTAYKCPLCDSWAWTEKQIRQHLSIKHKL